jgi:TupA-like ATPgrasp
MPNPLGIIMYHLPDWHWMNVAISHIQHFRFHKKIVSPKNTRCLNDLIFLRKISPRMGNYGYFVDKDLVKSLVSTMLGSEYLIPTLGCYNNKEALATFKHDQPYIVKPTHMSSKVLIKKQGGPLTPDEVNECASWLKESQFRRTREYNYRLLEPKLIIEPLVQFEGSIPKDYKFFVIHGKFAVVQVDSTRHEGHKRDFYDRNWNHLALKVVHSNSGQIFPKPREWEKMVELAEKLGSIFDFVRVDFYETDDGIKFGEITLTPGNGREGYNPKSFGEGLYQKVLA